MCIVFGSGVLYFFPQHLFEVCWKCKMELVSQDFPKMPKMSQLVVRTSLPT